VEPNRFTAFLVFRHREIIMAFRFDLTGLKNCKMSNGTKLTSFTLREVDGRDEELAANTAKTKGGSVTTTEELVRYSITHVNDEPIKQPYLQFDLWTSRARGFLLQAFREVNGFKEEESDLFLKTAEEVDAQPLPYGDR